MHIGEGFMEKTGRPVDDFRGRLTDSQRATLNAIWRYYFEQHKWIPIAYLYHVLQSKKEVVEPVIESLGGSIIFESPYNDQRRYLLTFLGFLLAEHGKKIEHILAWYVGYVKDQFIANPEINKINLKE